MFRTRLRTAAQRRWSSREHAERGAVAARPFALVSRQQRKTAAMHRVASREAQREAHEMIGNDARKKG
jgi:hypothetical protein